MSTKLSKEEREALPIVVDSEWIEDKSCDAKITDSDGDSASIKTLLLFVNNEAVNAKNALAVITAAGLNPWYAEAKALRKRVEELEKQLEDYPYGRCECGDERQMGWCSGGCDNDE